MAKIATQERTTKQQEGKNMGNNSLIDSSAYQVKQDVFDEANIIKQELNTVLERLEKMNQHRQEVSPSVFARVQQDYIDKKRNIQKAFEGKRKEISKELLGLYTARKEQENQVASLEQVLEEAKFRHFLGEYSDAKFQSIEAEQNEKIDGVKNVLGVINHSIEQYEQIVGGPIPEEPGTDSRIAAKQAAAVLPKPEPEVEAKPTPPPAPIQPVKEEKKVEDISLDNLDDELDLFLQDSGGDYFSAEPEKIVPEKPVAPVEAKAEEPKKPANFDDSLSNILRGIPLETPESEEAAATHEEVSDATKAKVPFEQADTEAKLIVLKGEYDEKEILLGENTSIGRSPTNDIVLKEAKVSRQHAAINFMNGNFVIVDLKSSNGVLVNVKRIEEHVLSDGDLIQIGSYQFKFSCE